MDRTEKRKQEAVFCFESVRLNGFASKVRWTGCTNLQDWDQKGHLVHSAIVSTVGQRREWWGPEAERDYETKTHLYVDSYWLNRYVDVKWAGVWPNWTK